MPSPISPANPPTYLIVNSTGTASLTVAPQQAAGPLMQVVITGSGAGYAPGVTYNVALSGGTGTPVAHAAIVVTGNVVTGVTITNNGGTTTPYTISDVLTIPGGGTAATAIVTYLPTAGSTLELSGVNALNWGSNIWESLYRLTENFAAMTAPGANLVLGGLNVTPILGQLWFDTTSAPGSLNVYVGPGFGNQGPCLSWDSLDTGAAVTSVTGTAPIVATPSVGPVVVSITSFSGSTPGAVPTSPGGTVDFLRADGTWAPPPAGGGGSVTSVGITGSTGLTVVGSPITTSGSIGLNLTAQLQSLSALPSNLGGVVQCIGANSYTTANLTSTQITTGLGYTPYNASNPAGYISASSPVTLTGNVTGTGPTTNVVTVIAPNVVTNARLAQAPALTIKGNNTAVIANVADLTVAQVLAMLPLFSTVTSANGVVPGSNGATSSFLRGDGTWAAAGGAPVMLATPIVMFDSGIFSAGTVSGGIYSTHGPLNNGWTNYNLTSVLGVVAKAVILEGHWAANAPNDSSSLANGKAGYILERADMSKGRTFPSGNTGPWVDTFAVAKSISADYQYWVSYASINQGTYPVRQVAQIESVTVSGKGGPVTTNYTLPAGSIDYLIPSPVLGAGGLGGAAVRIIGYYT